MKYFVTIDGEKLELKFTAEALEAYEEATGNATLLMLVPSKEYVKPTPQQVVEIEREIANRFMKRKTVRELLKYGLLHTGKEIEVPTELGDYATIARTIM